MTWINGDSVAKGSRVHQIVQPNATTETVRCSLVDTTGKVVWFADIAPGAEVHWSTSPPWVAPDDLTVQIGPPPPRQGRQTKIDPP